MRYNISCVEKILKSIKLIFINFSNGFVYQKLNQSNVLVLLVSFMKQCKEHVLQMTIGKTKHFLGSIHDFANKHSRFLIGNIRIFPPDMAI